MISVAIEQSGIFRRILCDQVTVISLGVAALHVRQHLVVAGLDRHLDVRHDLGQFGHGFHQFVGEVIGMRGQEADALDALDLMDDAQQRGQVWTIGDVLAVAIHDLSEQRDFLDALRCQRTDLRHDISHGTAALDAAPEGDDAERAGMRTAVDDRHVCADQVALLEGAAAG